MKVEFKKDLRHNYMVITEGEEFQAQPYCIQMLEQQVLQGLLPMERRSMDNLTSYYYDITGRQSIRNLYDKSTLSLFKVKSLLTDVMETIENTYEYLLPEDDYVLTPELIFYDLISNKVSLCYLPGYNKDIKEQMICLLEYLMNKVDYNDKDAVMLVYQLYGVSREEGFTLRKIQEGLEVPFQGGKTEWGKRSGQEQEKGSRQDSVILEGLRQESKKYLNKKYEDKKYEDRKCEDRKSDDRKCEEMKYEEKKREGIWSNEHRTKKVEQDIPIMQERIESEQEILVFPVTSYVYTGICLCVGVLALVLGFQNRFLYNAYGDRMEYGRMLGLILIILCTEGYLMHKIWDKKNKLSKIVPQVEYLDPRIAYASHNESPLWRVNISSLKKEPEKEYESSKVIIKSDQLIYKEDCEQDSEEDNHPTCLLNDIAPPLQKKQGLMLRSLKEEEYASIPIREFPFFIGKLKKNVDYYLENNGISRFHAKLTKEEELYYITDLNSTNGTFVNGVELQTYTKQEIKLGDEIALANLTYQFAEKR